MAPIGPTTSGSFSPVNDSSVVATGAIVTPARATALPERVDRDLRISRPTRETAEGPVDRTGGRAWVRMSVIAGSFRAVRVGDVDAAAVMPRW